MAVSVKPKRKAEKLMKTQTRKTSQEFMRKGSLAEGPGKSHIVKEKLVQKAIKKMK